MDITSPISSTVLGFSVISRYVVLLHRERNGKLMGKAYQRGTLRRVERAKGNDVRVTPHAF
jgi:hypothetical protein